MVEGDPVQMQVGGQTAPIDLTTTTMITTIKKSKKKVSVSVPEILVSEKKVLVSVSENLVSEKSFGFRKFGLEKKYRFWFQKT